MIIPALALLPLIIGMTIPIWFGLLCRPVWYLRRGADWLDNQTVAPVHQPVTICELRKHDDCGDRIVVTHYLAGWTREMQRKIRQHLLFSTACSTVLIVVFTVMGDPALRRPTATFGELVDQVRGNLPIPLLVGAALIEIFVVLKMASDQGAKFQPLIVAARPPREPFRTRVMTVVRRFRKPKPVPSAPESGSSGSQKDRPEGSVES